jgi:uncharacterized protein
MTAGAAEGSSGDGGSAAGAEGEGPASGRGADVPAPRVRALPVAATERIASVDVLRGFSLLGILVMNIYAYALPFGAYFNPLKGGGSSALDTGTWWVTHVLFEMKFMTLFSALFGAGMVLMAERAEARGARAGGTYYRRLLWLLAIGLVHSYLLWWGDILVWYALCGLVLYPLRRFSPRTLVVVGMVLILMLLPILYGFGNFVLPFMKQAAVEAHATQAAGETLDAEQSAAIEQWEAMREQMDPSEEAMDRETAVFRGSYGEQLRFRAPFVLQMHTMSLLFFGFWRVAGLMIVGMGLMKLGVFSASRSRRFYALCCAIGYGVGLPVVWLGAGAMWAHEFDMLYMNRDGGTVPNYLGSLLVALGHLGVVMLVCKSGALEALRRRLAAVGRMALSNYLAHTIICTTLFYGYALGLYGSFGRFQLMLFVLGIWIFQLLVSPVWLRRFRFGPAEWLWRSLTYWRRQPMRAAQRR